MTSADDRSSEKNWTYLAGKTGGQNSAGTFGGLYEVNDDGTKKKVYLKQDPEQDKNIAEVFASQFMRFIAEEIGENSDIVANVDYVNVAIDEAKSSNVYIASEVFEGYRDLFLDAYLAYQLPSYKKLRSTVDNQWQALPTKRPSFLQHNICIDNMISAGRYKNMIPGLALRAIVDDPDIHFENIGAVPIQRSNEQDLIPLIINGKLTGQYLKRTDNQETAELTINGESYNFAVYRGKYPEFKEAVVQYKHKFYLIPNINNARAGGIDFGGAFGDFRALNPRKFDGRIHTSKLLNFIRYRPSRSGPPSYMNQIPDELKEGNEFFKVLARYSMIDKTKIKDKIDSEIDRTVAYYRDKPKILLKFSQRIGINVPDSFTNRPDVIAFYIKNFLYTNFISRQEHAKDLFLDHFCRLDHRTQINLMNGYGPKENAEPNHDLMADFFTELKEQNTLLFNGLEQIESLILNQSQSLKASVTDIESQRILDRLTAMQTALHSRLCTAHLKGKLEKESIRIDEVLVASYELVEKFKDTHTYLSSDALPNDKIKAVEDFLRSVALYEKHCIQTSASQKFVIAACSFVGALVGIVVGAICGVLVGALIGGVLGNVIGAVSSGSITGIIVALKGAGIGTAIGAAAGSLIVGTGMSLSAGSFTRHRLFSSTNTTAESLSTYLSESLEKRLDDAFAGDEQCDSGQVKY